MDQEPIFLNTPQMGTRAQGIEAQPRRTSVLPDNPFVGLRPFEATDAILFFGRREQTKELLRILHQARFVAVVGSSGCGKSSLIRAGLIPNLEAGFLAGYNDWWHIAKMKPGSSPLLNLAASLVAAVQESPTSEQVVTLVKDIRSRGIKAVMGFLDEQSESSRANFLLLVDQFEELFRFASYDDAAEKTDIENAKVERQATETRRAEAADFISIMLNLSRQKVLPAYVVITMRSDFLGECDAFYGLPEAMNRGQYLVPRLTRTQRQEAIEKPIELYGTSIAPRLTDRVLNDMEDGGDQLPILQHALMRTWERWQVKREGPLDLDHYVEAGTIQEALSLDAETALEGMSTEEREIAKRMFQVLTTTDENGRRLRRPALLGEIVNVTGSTQEAVLKVIERFRSENRLFLILGENETTSYRVVDISHESLIRQWATLRGWVDEEVYSRDLYLRLANDAARYEANLVPLWSDPALQEALNWWMSRKPTEAWGRRYNKDFDLTAEFLRLSEKQRTDDEIEVARLKDEQARKEREELENAQRYAEQQQRIAEIERQQVKTLLEATSLNVRRAKVFAAILGALLIVASIIAISAFRVQGSSQSSIRNIRFSFLIRDSVIWTIVFFFFVNAAVVTQLRISGRGSLPALLRALIKGAPALFLASLSLSLAQPLVASAFVLCSIGQILSDLPEGSFEHGGQLKTLSFAAALVMYSIASFQDSLPGFPLLPLALTNVVITTYILRFMLSSLTGIQRSVKVMYFVFLIIANMSAATSGVPIFLGSSLWLVSDLSVGLSGIVGDNRVNTLETLGLFDLGLYFLALGFLR